ncbi:hypothetical protein NCAS_0C00140 [Naumovozyma castellii]|uniref:F-box domain-containing protein n=1 Tax=Naumovozyma castellii TaxID=27288 RepID=G0VBZ7_NAUCA|nr:hypothetical protein NCAS_0C00140 [Naumovozyma castellii CBS 4309]CCC69004.1 hypothetical protein NCAS_0C00140 [Naumovozyma castellii CBS 4309]
MNHFPIQEFKSNALSLQRLPPEILVVIFSYLDEKELSILQDLSIYFRNLINDEELWKNLFKARIHTNYFPSYSHSTKYSTEYVERVHGLKQWKHNKAVRTKYTISPSSHMVQQIESLYFDYPRCTCYNDGVITMVQLQSNRNKQRRYTYIPCTTPQGCSTMNFNINAAVFGRFDGRVFGKLLSNRSYLTPVTEFNSRHSACVTAITNSTVPGDSNQNWSVSGSENGEIIWWCETKSMNFKKVSNKTILHLSLYKQWTIVIDEEKIYVIKDMEEVNILPLPTISNDSSEERILQIHFFKVDFGSRCIVLANLQTVYVISFDVEKNFGFTRSITFPAANISDVIIDENTANREQDLEVAGLDGCYIAVSTMSDEVNIINIRAPGQSLKIQSNIKFDEPIYKCEVTNLVLAAALNGSLQIFDASSGNLIKTVQKTEKFPEFLSISQGRMIVGSGNTLNYLQFISDDLHSRKSKSSGSRNRSNKWNETMNSELQLYDDEVTKRREQEKKAEKLFAKYGGDIDEEELQLKIALMESEETFHTNGNDSNTSQNNDEENLRRVLEESRNDTNNLNISSMDIRNEDEEFLKAVEQSLLVNERSQETSHSNNHPPLTTTQPAPTSSAEDEELQLAIALSLSEISQH